MLAALLLLVVQAPTPDAPADDLAARVRPLLTKRCGACHGPDEATREAGLRLDTAEGLFGDLGGYAPVVAGDRDASELWYRVTTEDPDHRMPPAGQVGLELDEVALLGAWIDAGAPWQAHWAYVPPARPPVPGVADPAWVRNPVDAFVLARLEREGLAPTPPADPATLARRSALDLTGLPPDLDQLDAVLAAWERDPEAAWAAWLDGLFASVAHAEHDAGRWLDLARYADTNGYEKDAGRTIWPYRDWVIDAYDRDLPFDEFTRLQLAGDLVVDRAPDPDPDLVRSALVATGFHRNTMVNEEGGTDPEEFRVAAVMDRVETTATVWLGSTMACARCHTHKYDPITHADYYRTFALFDDTADTGGALAPTIAAPTDAQAAREVELERALEAARVGLEEPDADLDARQATWEAGLLAASRPAEPELGPWLRAEALTRDGYQAAFDGASALESLVLAGDDPFVGAGIGWRRAPEVVDGEVLTLEAVERAFLFCREVRVDEPRDVVLSLGSDDGVKVWLNGIEVHADPARRGVAPGQDRVEVRLPRGRSLLLVKVVNGGGPAGFVFELEAPRPGGLDAATFAALTTAPEERAPEAVRALRRHFRGTETEAGRARLADEAVARTELAALSAEIPTTPVLRRADAPRTTHVLAGGSFLAPREAVTPGAPPVLGPADLPSDRLELAAWLTSPGNPLTARVVANRLWQGVFGTGLVATPDDFGTQGEPPSHPALLDWLAVELVASGWDTERLQRLLVDSATWRQAAVLRPELLERDPDNRLLARASTHRLDAEVLRDQALAAAGLLDRTVGGPSVFPPQPEGTWAMTYSGERWATDTDGDRWRRGLYTYRRRTAPYPTFALFDAPSREEACVRRDRTATPLQALALLNDPAFFEAAQGLARRVLAEPVGSASGSPPEPESGVSVPVSAPPPDAPGAPDRPVAPVDVGPELDRARLSRAFRLCTSRLPSADELEVLAAYLADERARLAVEPDRAAALVASEVLPGAADLGLDPVELGAWTLVASALLNLDAVQTRR